jgi:ribonuclease HII
MTDSKALTPEAREELYYRILASASGVSMIAVAAESIDEQGIHPCNLRALTSALEGMEAPYDLALVDGFDLRRPDLGAQRLRGGDWLSAAVGAASVVAKVTRDRLMHSLDEVWPGYGFENHVGYATRQHQEALRAQGPCSLHRRSFGIVGAILRGEDVGGCPGCED